MRNVADVVSLLQTVIGGSCRFLDRSDFIFSPILSSGRILLQIFKEFLVRRLRLGLPLGVQCGYRATGDFYGGRCDTYKIAVTHNRNITHFLRVVGVK